MILSPHCEFRFLNKPDLIHHLKILSDDEELVLGDVTTLFIGGFHTTGNLLSWMFYYLAIHQDIQFVLNGWNPRCVEKSG